MPEIINFSDSKFPFYMFSNAHIIPILLLAGLVMGTYLLRTPLRRFTLNKAIRYTMASVLLLQEVSYHIWAIYYGNWSIDYSLPLQLCGVAALLSGVMLVTRSYSTFEVVYFWGLAGASQALLTPDLGLNSFPHYMYYKFFISHTFIILSVLFMTYVEDYRPSLKSIGKTLIITNLYAILVGGLNYFLGGNYLYLCNKPQGSSLLDYLGPWPWYIGSLEIILLLSCFICYLPFMLSYNKCTSKC